MKSEQQNHNESGPSPMSGEFCHHKMISSILFHFIGVPCSILCTFLLFQSVTFAACTKSSETHSDWASRLEVSEGARCWVKGALSKLAQICDRCCTSEHRHRCGSSQVSLPIISDSQLRNDRVCEFPKFKPTHTTHMQWLILVQFNRLLYFYDLESLSRIRYPSLVDRGLAVKGRPYVLSVAPKLSPPDFV